MIEHHQAVVKTRVAIGQFQIIDGPARQLRLHEILQIIAPIAEAAAQRKRQVNFIQQFVARHQSVQHFPRIAELEMPPPVQFATRTKRAKGQKRPGRDERIARLRRIEERAAQQHHPGSPRNCAASDSGVCVV